MATYANRDGGNIFVGVRRLCHDTGLSRATVLRAQAELQRAGMLIVTRSGGGRGRPTTYRLTVEATQLMVSP